jgi:hypothetical protein
MIWLIACVAYFGVGVALARANSKYLELNGSFDDRMLSGVVLCIWPIAGTAIGLAYCLYWLGGVINKR